MQRLVMICALLSVVVSVLSSFTQHPYSVAAPKRVMLQHLHMQGPLGAVVDTKLAVSGSDAMPVDRALQLSRYDYKEASYRDWQVRAPQSLRHDAMMRAPNKLTSLAFRSNCTLECRHCTP